MSSGASDMGQNGQKSSLYQQQGILVLVRNDQHRQRRHHSRIANSPGSPSTTFVEEQAWPDRCLPHGFIVGVIRAPFELRFPRQIH